MTSFGKIAILLLLPILSLAQIPVNTNFDVFSQQPIDTRDTITTLADTANITWKFEGLITYAADVDERWIWDGTKFNKLSSEFLMYGSGSPEGAVIADLGVLYTRTDATGGVFFKSTVSGNTGWIELPISEGGASSFTDLSDTPGSLSGQANKMVVVNPGETGTIFQDYIVDSTRLDADTLRYYQNGIEVGKDALPLADGTETIVTAGANINVSGDGSSGTPYVITGTGGGGASAGYIAQIHLDSFGAIPGDGINDDVAIQQAIDTLIANNYHTITMSPGGVYDIESIEILGDASDSTLVIWDLNGGTLQMTSQTTQTGNIYMRNADNYVFYNGTIAGEIDGSYAYDTNDVFLWWEQSSNITFHTIHFKAVSSHAFYGKNYDPTSLTEKRGAVWHNITFEGQNTDVDSFLQYSYIKYGKGAEYNIHSNIKKLGGYSLVRSEQGANDMWSNVIVLDSNIDNLSSSNKFETGIFYYAGISGGQNSGKLQLKNIKINHVDNIVPIVVKGDDTKTNNIVQISNVHLLVNGVQGSLNTQIHLKNCPDAVLDKIVYRPRDQLVGSIIDLDNSSRTRIINSHIEDTGYALKLTNSDSIYLANNYFDVRDDIDPASTGSAYYLSNEPNYPSVRAANADTYLAEGSRYSVTGEDVLLRKNSSATISSIDKPYLIFDDSTMISGIADASTEYMMEFDNSTLPSEWLQDTMRVEMRFRILSDSGATNQRFFWLNSGTPRIQVQGRRDNTIRVTTVTTLGTTNDNIDGGVWQDNAWHILVISVKDDSIKTFIDGNLVNNFEETAFRSDTLAVSDWFIGGPGLNSLNGWNGEIDYWEINGDRYEFGTANEPRVSYSTTGNISGSDYKPTRVFANDFDFSRDVGGRFNMELTSGSEDQTASEVYRDSSLYISNENVTFTANFLDTLDFLSITSRVNSSSTQNNTITLPDPADSLVNTRIVVYSDDLDNGVIDTYDTEVTSTNIYKGNQAIASTYALAGGETIELICVPRSTGYIWELVSTWDGWTSSNTLGNTSQTFKVERKSSYIFDNTVSSRDTLDVSDLVTGDEIKIEFRGQDSRITKALYLTSGQFLWNGNTLDSLYNNYGSQHLDLIWNGINFNVHGNSMPINMTGWAKYSSTTINRTSPQTITNGPTDTLTLNFVPTDSIVSEMPYGFESLYSSSDTTILAMNSGDGFVLRLDVDIRSSTTNNYAVFLLDIGGSQGVIVERTIPLIRGPGAWTRQSISFNYYTLDTFVANGGKIRFVAPDDNYDLANPSLIITKVHSASP